MTREVATGKRSTYDDGVAGCGEAAVGEAVSECLDAFGGEHKGVF